MRECGSSRLIFTMSGLVNKLRASSPENGGTRRVCLLDSTWQFFTAKSHFGRCSVSDSAHRVDKIENMMKLAATHRMKQKGGPNKGLKFIKLNFEVPPPKNDKLVRYGLISPQTVRRLSNRRFAMLSGSASGRFATGNSLHGNFQVSTKHGHPGGHGCTFPLPASMVKTAPAFLGLGLALRGSRNRHRRNLRLTALRAVFHGVERRLPQGATVYLTGVSPELEGEPCEVMAFQTER